MNPDNFTLGFLDDVDVEFTDAAAATAASAENYNAPADTPLFIVEMTGVNGDQHNQYFSLGDAADWAPNAEGEGFIPTSGKTTINATTNLGMFLRSLVDAGFPKEELNSGNLKCIIGTKCHVMQKQTERKSLKRGDDQNKPLGVLLVSKIHSLPGADTSKGGTGKAAAGKGAAGTGAKPSGGKVNGVAGKSGTAAADVNAEIDAKLVEGLIEALAETDPLPLKDVMKVAVKQFNGSPHKSAAISRSRNMEFLNRFKGDGDEGIKFDGAEFTLA
jgi:hypothetical protein